MDQSKIQETVANIPDSVLDDDLRGILVMYRKLSRRTGRPIEELTGNAIKRFSANPYELRKALLLAWKIRNNQ